MLVEIVVGLMVYWVFLVGVVFDWISFVYWNKCVVGVCGKGFGDVGV